MLMRFLTGLSPMGYIISILSATLLLSWSAMFFMGRNISSLHEDIGAYEATVNNLVGANLDTRESLDQVEELLQACMAKRNNADNKASEARQEIARKQKEAYIASDERRDAVEDEIELSQANCIPATLPPRAAELLIDAARSANRGADGT